MSSISSISGGSSLYSYLQNLSSTTESQIAAPTTATTDAATASTATSSGQAVEGGHHHHHGHGKGGQSQLFQQIQQAVTTALQQAQQSGSTDPNQNIEDAIASVFKNQTAGASQQTAGQTPDTDGNSTAAPGSATTPGAGNSSATQAFFQSLQSFGIDPQQFHQDFLSAVQDVQNGNTVSASSLFQNLPPGSILDTLG